MTSFIGRLAEDAASPLIDMQTRLLRKAGLFLVAGIFGAITFVFLIFALYGYLEPMIGALYSDLAIAAIFAVLCVICLLLAFNSGKGNGRHGNYAPDAEKAMNRATQIDEMAAPVLALLQQAGLQRESLALNAGLAIAKQLGPFSLVAMAIMVGFFTTRMFIRPSQVEETA